MTITVARQSALKMPLCRRPDLPQGPYAVVGLRRAGSAAVEALCRLAGGGGQVIACDRNPGGVTKRISAASKPPGYKCIWGRRAKCSTSSRRRAR